MSTFISPENEQFLAETVARGMFVDTSQALDEALRLLRAKLEIEEALLAGLRSGDPIPVTPEFWADQREKILRRYESRQK